MTATRGGGVDLNLNGDSILKHSAKTLLHTSAHNAEDEGHPRPSRFGIAALKHSTLGAHACKSDHLSLARCKFDS